MAKEMALPSSLLWAVPAKQQVVLLVVDALVLGPDLLCIRTS